MQFYIAQAVGIVAMTVAFISFQQKTQKGIVAIQMLSSGLWTVHLYLLGAYTGCLLNFMAVIRDAIFAQRNKYPWASHIGWL